MLKPRLIICMFCVGMIVFGPGMVSGQDYPNKPIRMVTGASGGGTDFTGRLISHGLTGSLGQQVIVDNRGGAIAPSDTVAKAPPDGYEVVGNSREQFSATIKSDIVKWGKVIEVAGIRLD